MAMLESANKKEGANNNLNKKQLKTTIMKKRFYVPVNTLNLNLKLSFREVKFVELRNSIKWKTGNCKMLSPSEFVDEHLEHTIHWLSKINNINDTYEGITYKVWLAIFKEERKFRKLKKEYLKAEKQFLEYYNN